MDLFGNVLKVDIKNICNCSAVPSILNKNIFDTEMINHNFTLKHGKNIKFFYRIPLFPGYIIIYNKLPQYW